MSRVTEEQEGRQEKPAAASDEASVRAATHRSSEVNEFLSHLDNKVVFGHEGAVQALIKLY